MSTQQKDEEKQSPVSVCDFSIEKLIDIFAEYSGSDKDYIRGRQFVDYFDDYFKELDAKTIVIEKEYIDRDYVDDFSYYYVKCFEQYKKTCVRLHFFSCSFKENDLISFLKKKLEEKKEKNITDSYIGYIIVKPLPKTIIGRTCLKTYKNNKNAAHERCYPIIKPCFSNLFGIPLRVDSIPFQEQDSVVAACATSALWSVFHGTANLFQHRILSPVEITKRATSQTPNSARYFPNVGLSAEQLAAAIRTVGLEPIYINIQKMREKELKGILYAFLNAHIPLLLGIEIFNEDGSWIGDHAVAVTGYGIDNNIKEEKDIYRLSSSKIDKLYVHDDQIGPFARMEFDGYITRNDIPGYHVTNGGHSVDVIKINSGWTRKDLKRYICPLILIAPVYHKIRIPYSLISDIIDEFNSVLPNRKNNNYEWDIVLTTVNELKEKILKNLSFDRKEEILLERLPKYIWKASCKCKNKHRLDILFDATDIEQGKLGIKFVKIDITFFDSLRDYLIKAKTIYTFSSNTRAKLLIDAFTE